MNYGESGDRIRYRVGKVDISRKAQAANVSARAIVRFLTGRRRAQHMIHMPPANAQFEPAMYRAAFEVLVTELSILDKEDFFYMQAQWGRCR